MTLPITLGLIPGESLHGCLLRHAELNMYDSMHWIAGLVGAETSDVKKFSGLSQYAEKFGELLAVPESELAAASYLRNHVNGSSLSGFGNQTFSRNLIDFTHPAVCPQCLRDSEHIRQVWDLSLLVACPHHGKLLLRSCPSCGRRLRWGRSTISHCDCGFDLRTATMPSIPESTRHLMELFYVATREPSSKNDFGFSRLPILKIFNLAQLTDLIFYLGRWLRFGHKLYVANLPSMSIEGRIDLCSNVGNVLQTWPDGWRKVIVDCASKKLRDNDQLFGLQAIFGRLYTKLFEGKSATHIGFLRDEFLKLVSDGDISRLCSVSQNQIVFAGKRVQNKLQNKYATADDAQKTLGIGAKTFEWLKKTGKLKVQTKTFGQKAFHMIDRTEIASAKAYLESLIFLHGVAQQLGISKSLVERLARTEILPAVRGRSVDGYRNWIFEKEALEKLRLKLNQQAKRCSKRVAEKLIPLSAAIAGTRTFGVQAADLLNAIFESRLQIFKTSESIVKLDDVMVSHHDVLSFGQNFAHSKSRHSNLPAT